MFFCGEGRIKVTGKALVVNCKSKGLKLNEFVSFGYCRKTLSQELHNKLTADC
jgi:hypothetical protein